MDSRRIVTIDIGNTAAKVSLYEGEQSVESLSVCGDVAETVDVMLRRQQVDGVICSCVGDASLALLNRLSEEKIPIVWMSPSTNLPIEIGYDCRATLGSDRVAAAVGVADVADSVLVVDIGTAVTLDVVDKGRFIGGNISPGISLRFEALHTHTSLLPLVSAEGETPLLGHNTETAIRAGVVRGVAYEIAGAYKAASLIYKDLKLVLTGGSAPLVEPLLRECGIELTIDSIAVERGMVRIFNYNN